MTLPPFGVLYVRGKEMLILETVAGLPGDALVVFAVGAFGAALCGVVGVCAPTGTAVERSRHSAAHSAMTLRIP